MESYVIFGGSGFIGSHLVKELQKNESVKVVVADIKEPTCSQPPNVVFKYCDVRKPIDPCIASGPSVVVNLAAVHRTPGHADHEYFDTNVKGAQNIVRFCEATGSKTLWFTSSIATYGPTEDPLTETSPIKPNSAYGKSKLEAEKIHRLWQDGETDRKLIIVRPAVVFGAGENGNFTKLAKALKRGLFVYPGRKDTIKSCGYVEDLIGSLFFMNDQSEGMILYNYSYPTRYSIEDICQTFAKVAGLHCPLGTIPLPLMVNLAKIFQVLNRLGLKNGIHPARMYKLTRSTNILPAELVRRGYPYKTELEEGLRRWLQEDPKNGFI